MSLCRNIHQKCVSSLLRKSPQQRRAQALDLYLHGALPPFRFENCTMILMPFCSGATVRAAVRATHTGDS